MKHKRMLAGTLVLGMLLVMAVGMTQAQGPEPPEGKVDVKSEVGATSITPGAIPIQGRLTDATGNPLADGNYSVTFRLYESEAGGSPICSDTNTVTVADRLFSSYMDNCYDDLYGQKVWLSVQVEGDNEMTPRQPIYAVPYALSLRPGAVISHTSTSAALNVFNHGNGWGLNAYSEGHDAVHARSNAADHAGVSGTNSGGGIGVYAYSETGTALRTAGTGIIQSSARSYLWISGNDVRPFHESDGVIIDADNIGGAKIYRGPNAGNKNVMLPITIVGPLYGQDVTLTSLTIYFVGDSEFEGITAVLLRRQTGVCATSDCYATILYDTTDHSCDEATNPTGCAVTYDLTQNNVLTSDSGILYLTIELTFGGETTWFELGGVRLTLEHD